MKEIRYFAALMLIISLMGLNASALPSTGNENGNLYAPGGVEGAQYGDYGYNNGYDNGYDAGYGNSYNTNYASSSNEDYGNTYSRDQGNYYDDYSLSSGKVTLTLYVLEKNGDGTPLTGATVASYDAMGNLYQGMTDANGFVIISGQAGLWRFAIGMEGYKTLNLAFNVTQTSAAIATIERIDQAEEANGRAEGLADYREETFDRTENEPVVLTVYVHESDLNGTLLGGVYIEGLDAGGERFTGYTGSSGVASLEGEPGTWQFSFSKEGYDALRLNYSVTESREGAVYLKRTAEPQDKVALTVHIHENNLNGTELSDVLIFGQDGGKESFSEATNSEGIATIIGEPGTWQFVFTKEGYETLHISYNVTETQDAAAYLKTETPEAQFSLMPPSE